MTWEVQYGPQTFPDAQKNVGANYNYAIVTPASELGWDAPADLVIAWELLSGDKYARNTGLPSPFKQFWKTGTGDAATESKSGYSSANGATACIEFIERDGDNLRLGIRGPSQGQTQPKAMWIGYANGAAPGFANPWQLKVDGNAAFTVGTSALVVTDSIEFFTGLPPDPEPQDPPPSSESDAMRTLAQIQAGEWHAASHTIVGVAGQKTFFQLRNPGTSKWCLLHKVKITVEEDSIVEIRSQPAAVGTPFPNNACNNKFGGSASGMVRNGGTSINPNGTGGEHIAPKLKGGLLWPILLDVLYQDNSAIVVVQKLGVGATCTFEWWEWTP